MNVRTTVVTSILLGLLSATAVAQDADPDQAASLIWQKVHASIFAGAPMDTAQADKVITLEAPRRAEDAAIVPIAIRAQFEQTPSRYIDRVWLLIDKNPSPIAAEFHLSPRSGRADIETRVRIEEYSHVRAVARTNDGKHYMVSRYVKASGGCSAPAGKDAAAAMASLGKMRLRVADQLVAGQPAVAQVMVSHPNDSGLVKDQVTHLYAPAYFVRRIEVSYNREPVLIADVDFSISENPNLRFYFTPTEGGELSARVVDTKDLSFQTSLKLDPQQIARAARQ
jgi:sulfur-oxidizing protein SoxY